MHCLTLNLQYRRLPSPHTHAEQREGPTAGHGSGWGIRGFCELDAYVSSGPGEAALPSGIDGEQEDID